MIVRRYIHSEILRRFFWVVGLLFLIYSSDRFVNYLAVAAAGNIPIALVFEMLCLKLVSTSPKLLPIALFLAVILTYSRLKSDNEMVILSSSGMGTLAQLKIVFYLMCPACGLVASITLVIAPMAETSLQDLKYQAKQEADITGIVAGQFKEFSQGEKIVYVESLADNKTMKNVFLQTRQHGKLEIMTAARATLELDENSGNRYIKFEDGDLYIGVLGEPDYQIVDYKTYATLLASPKKREAVTKKLRSIPTSVLWSSERASDKAELQWRISAIISCMLLPLLAVVLCQLSIGDKRYTLVLIAMLIYFIYGNFLEIAKSLLKRDEIPAIVGLWWVHALLIMTMVSLYYAHQIKRRW